MGLLAIAKNGEMLHKGDIITSFRNNLYTFHSVTHPRKVTVTDDNGHYRDFYANVFELGIMDDVTGTWTFVPSWA